MLIKFFFLTFTLSFLPSYIADSPVTSTQRTFQGVLIDSLTSYKEYFIASNQGKVVVCDTILQCMDMNQNFKIPKSDTISVKDNRLYFIDGTSVSHCLITVNGKEIPSESKLPKLKSLACNDLKQDDIIKDWKFPSDITKYNAMVTFPNVELITHTHNINEQISIVFSKDALIQCVWNNTQCIFKEQLPLKNLKNSAFSWYTLTKAPDSACYIESTISRDNQFVIWIDKGQWHSAENTQTNGFVQLYEGTDLSRAQEALFNGLKQIIQEFFKEVKMKSGKANITKNSGSKNSLGEQVVRVTLKNKTNKVFITKPIGLNTSSPNVERSNGRILSEEEKENCKQYDDGIRMFYDHNCESFTNFGSDVAQCFATVVSNIYTGGHNKEIHIAMDRDKSYQQDTSGASTQIQKAIEYHPDYDGYICSRSATIVFGMVNGVFLSLTMIASLYL